MNPRWRHNGTELFFVSPDDSIMAVDVKLGATFSADVPHSLFQLKGADRVDLTNYDVRADGQRFLIFMARKPNQDASITVVVNWWRELRSEP
jgi:hypothetical protein